MRKKQRVIKWLSFVIVLALLICAGQTFLFRNMDYDQRRLEGFYMEEPDSLDVVFLGSSEIFRAFSSAQAYKEYGFTSYPYALNGNPATLWKYELQDIIDRQHPQLIIVETNGVLYDDDLLHQEVCVRRAADNMPESKNRRAMILEQGQDDLLSYYLPITKYHSNWEDPKKLIQGAFNAVNLYQRGYTYLKGSSTNTSKVDISTFRDIEGDMTEQPLGEEAEQILREFLESCLQNKIENVVFVRFPHFITESENSYIRCARNNAAGRIIESYGFDYINLDRCLDEMGVEISRDFFNSEHMNAYGMQKMTTWFGKYLMDSYSIVPKAQSEKNAGKWNLSAAYMQAFYDYFDEVMQEGNESGSEIGESVSVLQILEKYLKINK